MTRSFRISPSGPFSLAVARRFFEGFTPAKGSWSDAGDAMVLAFPIEGWRSSTAVVVRQTPGGSVVGEVFGTEDAAGARRHVARCLSLDHDGTGWPRVGERDAVLGGIQREMRFLRPVCFSSPYEAAAHAMIGHRISMRQASRIKGELAATLGQTIDVRGRSISAFPLPRT